MKPEIAEKWVNALESGKYKQGYFRLRTGAQYCCLGVLCDLASKEGVGKWKRKSFEKFTHNPIYNFDIGEESSRSSLPVPVMKWAGMDVSTPTEMLMSALANMNDSQAPFSEIAKQIKERADSL